jgi:hypothetical protein
MSLSEQRILKSVEILPAQNAINVLWVDQIMRDGEVVSELNHRKAYTQDQREAFLTEVGGGAAYVAAVGW